MVPEAIHRKSFDERRLNRWRKQATTDEEHKFIGPDGLEVSRTEGGEP